MTAFSHVLVQSSGLTKRSWDHVRTLVRPFPPALVRRFAVHATVLAIVASVITTLAFA